MPGEAHEAGLRCRVRGAKARSARSTSPTGLRSTTVYANWVSRILGLAAAVLLVSCTSVPKIPAKGTFHGEVVDTTVDSQVARYYLETYLQGGRTTSEWDRKLDALAARPGASLPSHEDLNAIAKDLSVDVATLFFADRLLHDDCNQQINKSFAFHRSNPQRRPLGPGRYLILFVPGWDYAENGHLTGADFARPRHLATKLGLENHLVPLPPTGSVEENAAIVAAEIKGRAASDKKILIAGASSAGPAIHLALAELLSKRDLQPVKAWINLGGILQGTPLVDYFGEKPQAWLMDLVAWSKGWDSAAISSMGTLAGRKRFQRLRIDAELLVINYLGVPLSGQFSPYAKDKYPILRDMGPNDGLTLLPDAIAPKSLTIVALGSDHFFAEDPRIDEKTTALMALVVAYVEGTDSLACRGAAPICHKACNEEIIAR